MRSGDLRLLVLTVPHHPYAGLILAHLLQRRHVTAVVESGVLLHGRSFPSALWRYLRSSGVSYVAHQAVKQWAFRIATGLATLRGRARQGDLLYDYRSLARGLRVPVVRVRDINSPEALAWARALAPSLVVSVYFNQLLGREALGLAPLGAINAHPALLPGYRGVSPVFWALANGEQEAGFTLHEMDAGVDTGRILAQARLAIEPGDTEHSLYLRLTRAGLPLLDSVLDAYPASGPPHPESTGEPRYFSLPTRAAVARFRRQGRRFF
jgi:methionyl-tRNA formyltransferase